MKNFIVVSTLTVVLIMTAIVTIGCGPISTNSTYKERQQQEQLSAESSSQVNMPGIKNFREKKLLKDILELRDQEALVTYTYISSEYPVVVRGYTALGGKLTYVGESVGYGIPYATQFTNPEKTVAPYYDSAVVKQQDPNGLYSPDAAEGTWVLIKDPSGKQTLPVYIESRIVVSPFKFPLD
jgi:hypothetical protein